MQQVSVEQKTGFEKFYQPDGWDFDSRYRSLNYKEFYWKSWFGGSIEDDYLGWIFITLVGSCLNKTIVVCKAFFSRGMLNRWHCKSTDDRKRLLKHETGA